MNGAALPPDHRPRFEDDALWSLVILADSSLLIPIDESPPLFSSCRTQRALEVWTECELSALQALVWIALQRHDDEILTRTLDAARWHLEHTQPDNATNHPWGIPTFLLLASRQHDIARESELYASTLLHNSLVTSGTPDPLSQRILTDAARQLDAILESDCLN
jgi:hypothetical protein